MRTDYAGIDYGRGMANVDNDTGIRYGVIPLAYLIAPDELETIFPCCCPQCGEDANPDTSEAEYTCKCGYVTDVDNLWGDEPIGYRYNDEGIVIEGHSDGDLFIVKSPVAIHAQFCSPCAPGAGHLCSPCKDGPLTYALPLDWLWSSAYEESDLIKVEGGAK